MLLLKILYRFMVGVIGLSTGLTFVMVLMVFVRGTGILHARSFPTSIEIVAFFIPVASAAFVFPSTIGEHRGGKIDEKHKVKSIFWEPPD